MLLFLFALQSGNQIISTFKIEQNEKCKRNFPQAAMFIYNIRCYKNIIPMTIMTIKLIHNVTEQIINLYLFGYGYYHVGQ